MTDKILQDVMIQALNKTEGQCTCEGDPQVMSISPVFYSEFSKLVNRTTKKNDNTKLGDGDGILVNSGMDAPEEYPHTFRITLKEPKKYLYRLKVVYEDDTQEEFTPTEAKNGQVTEAGTDSENRKQYWVRLKKFPQKYELTAKELGMDEAQYSGEWPRTRSHFSVTFNNFKGDFSILKERLLDKTEDPTSEPIDQIAEFADTQFLLASINFDIPPGDGPEPIPNNQITIVAKPRAGIDVVWVKLPFNSKDVGPHLKPWNSLPDGKAVIEKLRTEERDEGTAAEPTELSSESPAKWYKLVRDEAKGTPTQWYFSRTFRLPDQRVFAQKYSPLHVATIYQTDEGDNARASIIGKDWVKENVLTAKDDADLQSSDAEPGDAPADVPPEVGTPAGQ